MHRVVDGHPDEHAGNMISDNTAWLRSDPSARYCFTIRNPSPHKLFPYLFYFNPHDCAIDCFYEPPNRHRPPLRRLEDLLTVGMGAEPAFQFMLPPGMPSSSGFFKLFVSTNYVDLGWIEQRPSLENYPVQELYARVFNPETLRDSYWADLQVMLVLNKGDDEVIPQLDGDPDTTTIRQEDTRTGPQEMARPPSLPPSPSSSNADKAVFALIIGINKYQSTDFSTIRGAVNDAKAFESYLLDPREKQGLAVPASNIVLLLNEQATRENILETFRSHFLNNPNIPDGGKTTMILFFAGHGSRIEAPDNLLSRDGKVSAICPYDCDRTPNASGNNVSSIPEYILGRLLSELAVKKGPNITVILDSAHAGGMGRNVGGISGVTPPIELDSDLKDKIDSEMSRPFRMWPQSMTSYCLLAACGDEDMCYETPAQDNQLVHGRFTYHLIDQLRKAPLENTTYTELLNLIPTLPNQIPQCSGSWRYCLVFSTNYPVRGSRRALPT
ncbi:hypothetical protein C8R44DRAFT_198080 [Mycena epipterygia]|nr:hypothetical protein C8R44DRAFT_198080 [Mycena epipterygia]